MEDETVEKSAKGSPLPMAIGILGLLLGLIAIALSLSAMVKVGSTASSMDDKIEKAAALALDLKKIGDRMDAFSAEIEALKGGDNARIDNLTKQVKAAVERIGTILSEDRKLIEENREAIEKVAKSRAARASVSERTPPERSTAQSQTQSEPAQGGGSDMIAYKIQPGDTFGKIAPKFGVSVDEIISANPDANPSRLRIGQTINIPRK